jgi:hypothetical protein
MDAEHHLLAMSSLLFSSDSYLNLAYYFLQLQS